MLIVKVHATKILFNKADSSRSCVDDAWRHDATPCPMAVTRAAGNSCSSASERRRAYMRRRIAWTLLLHSQVASAEYPSRGGTAVRLPKVVYCFLWEVMSSSLKVAIFYLQLTSCIHTPEKTPDTGLLFRKDALIRFDAHWFFRMTALYLWLYW
jgi:hypothetical protein